LKAVNLLRSLPARQGAVSINVFLETEYYYIEGHIFDTDLLVVVFEPAGGLDPRPSAFRLGWGVEVFRKRQKSVLAIKPKRVNWYVTPDLEQALTDLRDFFHEFDRVVTYGASMGGYGALLYADTVSAKQVFAFSPQSTLDPSKIVDRRFPRAENWDFTTALGDVQGRFDSVQSAYIIYDKNAPMDYIHVRRIRQANLVECHVPGSGHSSIEICKACGALQMIVQSIISGSFDQRIFAKLLRKRKALAQYRQEVSKQWNRRSLRLSRDQNFP
jgi:hypothetical protein